MQFLYYCNMKKTLLEICCYSVQSAIIAEDAGANRIELCAGIHEGGTTPSHSCISQAMRNVDIPVHVIIRPRGADFLYSSLEFETMKEDILHCKKLGVDGIVSGILLADGTIDTKRTMELVELAKPMNFTFHRAFDMVKDFSNALEILIDLGVSRVLTSGGEQTAEQGVEKLKELNVQANGRIKIMPGSGVSYENIQKLKEITKATEFHCSAKLLVRGKMNYQNPNIAMGGEESVPEFEYYEADSDKIRKIVTILKAKDD